MSSWLIDPFLTSLPVRLPSLTSLPVISDAAVAPPAPATMIAAVSTRICDVTLDVTAGRWERNMRRSSLRMETVHRADTRKRPTRAVEFQLCELPTARFGEHARVNAAAELAQFVEGAEHVLPRAGDDRACL